MDIKSILKEYDQMFTVKSPDEIVEFLAVHVDQARKEGDQATLITLLNEQIGYARDRGMKKTCLQACESLKGLLDDMNLDGTLPYGHSLLNIANAYRAMGSYDEAGEIFPEIEKVYRGQLEDGAYEFAALYNNWSLLSMDMGRPYESIEYLKRSLEIIDSFDNAGIKQATSRVNLACAILALPDGEEEEGGIGPDSHNYRSKEKRIAEAKSYIDQAIRLFEEKGGDDYHYGSALSARGDVHALQGRYADAIEDYRRARDIVKAYMGETDNTSLLEKKIAQARAMID